MEKRDLNSTHGSKLCAASLLILGMEGLRPGRLLPISQAAIGDAGSVKHMREQEHGKTAEHSHDVHRLFRALSSQTQRDVEALYNNCCVEYKASVQAGKQQHGSGAVAVDMANLEEALQWNQGAVKDLKYEMTPRGRSVPTGLFWDSDHVWVVPSAFPNFAIELARWAARHSFKRLTP